MDADICPFSLLKQSSLAKEKVSQNGIQKLVHVVVKNQPFLIQVKLDNSRVREKIELSKLTVEPQLLYDLESLKEVSFVKLRPLESKFYRGGDHGEVLTVEVKIKVLSSQLEDSFFRIRLNFSNSSTKQPIHPNWSIVSEPVKVVSKPEQVRKRKQSVEDSDQSVLESSPSSSTTSVKNNNNSKEPYLCKRERTELIIQQLSQIEAICFQQKLLLSQLYQTSAVNKGLIENLYPFLSPIASFEIFPSLCETKKGFYYFLILLFLIFRTFTTEIFPVDSFENAFQEFLHVCTTTEEPSRKIRKMFANQSKPDSIMAEEFLIEMRSLVTKQKLHNSDLSSISECNCPNCPHRRELENIFSNDFSCEQI